MIDDPVSIDDDDVSGDDSVGGDDESSSESDFAGKEFFWLWYFEAFNYKILMMYKDDYVGDEICDEEEGNTDDSDTAAGNDLGVLGVF